MSALGFLVFKHFNLLVYQLSVFKNSAWEWSSTRGQYYLHQFTKEQPDLNYAEEAVVEAMNVRKHSSTLKSSNPISVSVGSYILLVGPRNCWIPH